VLDYVSPDSVLEVSHNSCSIALGPPFKTNKQSAMHSEMMTKLLHGLYAKNKSLQVVFGSTCFWRSNFQVNSSSLT